MEVESVWATFYAPQSSIRAQKHQIESQRIRGKREILWNMGGENPQGHSAARRAAYFSVCEHMMEIGGGRMKVRNLEAVA